MRILLAGDPKAAEYLKKKPVRFQCLTCGCIFEATNDEYKMAADYDRHYQATCPCCYQLATASREGEMGLNEYKMENISSKFVKIQEVTEEHILFSSNSKITFDHEQDCCEYNYADFKQLDDIGRNAEFMEPLSFEKAEYGFRFGNPGKMFFVPCYSEQNGYYSADVDIYYNGEKVFTIEAEERDG